MKIYFVILEGDLFLFCYIGRDFCSIFLILEGNFFIKLCILFRFVRIYSVSNLNS